MAINKLITSEGNVQFIFGDTGKIINVHPFHIYTSFNEDTVSFILIGLPKSTGLAIFTSRAEDLEVNGEVYSFENLPDALAEAFAIAGAQMRYEVVDELPETGQTNTIYLVPKETGSGFDEYIYIRDTGEWELIGDTDIELARYLKKEDFNAYSAATKLKIDYISGATDYLSGAVDTEIARATSAETELQTAIDNEASARTEADATLQTNIDNETSARTSADTALQTAIDNETSARTEADNALQSAIDTVSGNVETETSRATSAETELQTAIDNEASARTSADTALQTAIDNEASARTEAISGLTDRLGEDEEVWGEALNELNASISAVNDSFSAYSTSAEVTAEINAATSGLATPYSAGTNIDITNNVISVTGITIETSSAITSGDTNPVQGGAVYDVTHVDPYGSEQTYGMYFPANGVTATSWNDMAKRIAIRFGGNKNKTVTELYVADEQGNLYSTWPGGDYNTYDESGNAGTLTASDGYRIAHVKAYWEMSGEPMGAVLTVGQQIYSGGTAADVIEGVIEPELIRLDSQKLDASAYTPTDLSNYYTKSETDSAITAATSGLQETLSAGTNIDITNNVISVTGISIETSSAVTSGDTNPVQGGAIYDALDEVEQVTARALNELSEADEVTARALIDLNDKFGGLKLQKITQSAYDALVSGGTTDSNTLYIISD